LVVGITRLFFFSSVEDCFFYLSVTFLLFAIIRGGCCFFLLGQATWADPFFFISFPSGGSAFPLFPFSTTCADLPGEVDDSLPCISPLLDCPFFFFLPSRNRSLVPSSFSPVTPPMRGMFPYRGIRFPSPVPPSGPWCSCASLLLESGRVGDSAFRADARSFFLPFAALLFLFLLGLKGTEAAVRQPLSGVR